MGDYATLKPSEIVLCGFVVCKDAGPISPLETTLIVAEAARLFVFAAGKDLHMPGQGDKNMAILMVCVVCGVRRDEVNYILD